MAWHDLGPVERFSAPVTDASVGKTRLAVTSHDGKFGAISAVCNHAGGPLGEGRIDVTPLVTGRVDLDGVPAAFRELATPERHAKILIKP